MPNFDRYTDYNAEAGISSVVFGADAPVLEVELNEMQEIQKNLLGNTIKNLLGNGISDLDSITYKDNILQISDGAFIAVDGYLVQSTDLYISDVEGKTVYLQVWEEIVDSSASLKKNGSQHTDTTIGNYMRDSRMPFDTTKRKVVKYMLSTSSDPNKHNIDIASVSEEGVLAKHIKELSLSKLSDRVLDLLSSPTLVEAKVVCVGGIEGPSSKYNLDVTVGGKVTKGRLISFQSPYNSFKIVGFSVNGEEYDIVDSDGISLLGKTGVWESYAIISVVLDTDTYKAYMQTNCVAIKHYNSPVDLGITLPTTFDLICKALPKRACTLQFDIYSKSSNVYLVEGELPSVCGELITITIEGGSYVKRISIVDSLGDEYIKTAYANGPSSFKLTGWKKVATDTVEDISDDFFTMKEGFTLQNKVVRKQGSVISGSFMISGDFKANELIILFGINSKYNPGLLAILPTLNVYTSEYGVEGPPTFSEGHYLVQMGLLMCTYYGDAPAKWIQGYFTYILPT